MKVTWKGEEATKDLEETERFGKKFKKGEAVEVTDPVQLSKLAKNPNFDVPDYKEDEPQPTVLAPSQQQAQFPAPKPGEPVEAPSRPLRKI